MIKDIQSEIIKLKTKKDMFVLAHSYQGREITEVADFVGDSYALSVKAANVPHKTILMCGVRFMAETVKILSPDKTVILVNPMAGCPMAEQMDTELVRYVKSQNPNYTVVCYINTTSELKTICDVCVTSSSAVKIISNIDNKDILFLPDANLGSYIADKLPNKNIKLLQGGCPVHSAVTAEDVSAIKQKHPKALLLVHPECIPEVVKLADFVGSTSEIMDYAKQSKHDEFIIGTELSISEHLQYDCPDKEFYPLSSKIMCPNMKLTTLMDLYKSMLGTAGEVIILSEEIISKSKVCIDEMIRLNK